MTALGRYQLLRHLASGGMAEIWLAGLDTTRRHESGPFRFSCPTHAVIKMITPGRANDRQYVQMFLDEARVAATLHHPNIAQLYEVGCVDGTYYHALEYVHGENVRATVERSLKVRKRTPLAVTMAIGRSMAAALHYAHERKGGTGEALGIVHRDVTPSNIMIGWDGVVRLLDFGVALAAGRSTETRAGVVKGKLAYMSPEQCRGMKVDRRTDVYALGVVLYEVSLRKRAFHGHTEYQMMERIVRGDVVPPTQVDPSYPPELEKIVMKAMATDREERYATAAELGAALAEFARAHGIADGPAVVREHMQSLYDHVPPPDRARAPSPSIELIAPAGTDPGTADACDTLTSPVVIAAAAPAPRSRKFASGTGSQPMTPASSGVPCSEMRAVTERVVVSSSRTSWIIAALVLLAGVVAAAMILLSAG